MANLDVQLTREIFGNVSDAWRIAFYCAALVSTSIFAWGLYRRVQVWRLGRPVHQSARSTIAAKNIVRYVVLQKRMSRCDMAGIAHGLLFGGFCVLFVGTVLVAVEHGLATLLRRPAGNPVFHVGAYFAVFESVLDAAGIALLAGCVLFAFLRWKRPNQRRHALRNWLLLGLFIAIGLTGYVVEAMRILREQTPWPGFSFVGYALASTLSAAHLAPERISQLHLVVWWLHALLSLTLIAVFPWTRLLHALAGAVRLAAGIDQLGALTNVDMEEVERTGELGAANVRQFSRTRILELDACVACGRCERACPATEAGKTLSPRDVVQDIRDHLQNNLHTLLQSADDAAAPNIGGVIPGEIVSEESIWSCTGCSACVDVCPLGVSPLGFITEMRRRLIVDGRLRGAPGTALERTQRSKNPWGMPARDRTVWTAGLNVPTVQDNPGFDVLYWVGCAAAYDVRLQRVARSVIRLLIHADVNFAILGPEERCTGETARRMGDELLFRELAAENLAIFERIGLSGGTKTILAHCPHCVNSFLRDYPHLGANLRAVHHTQYLVELMRSGRIVVERQRGGRNLAERVTYHDPCYLARACGVVDAPREILDAAVGGQNLVELPRCGRDTACCGAGGGRMWFDDSPATRIGRSRINEVIATGAGTLAVACPFCQIMTGDGVAAQGGNVAVRDVAEILSEAIFGADGIPVER